MEKERGGRRSGRGYEGNKGAGEKDIKGGEKDDLGDMRG